MVVAGRPNEACVSVLQPSSAHDRRGRATRRGSRAASARSSSRAGFSVLNAAWRTNRDFLGKGLRFPVSDQPERRRVELAARGERAPVDLHHPRHRARRAHQPPATSAARSTTSCSRRTTTSPPRAPRSTARKRSTSSSRASRRSTCRAQPNADEPNRLDIRIEYVIAGKNDKRNLVFPFYLKNEDDEAAPPHRQQRYERPRSMIPPPKLDDRTLPRHRRGSHLDDPALRAGVDESQSVRSGHHADRARRVDDRPAHLSAQPGSRQELRRVPEPARHQAARAARGEGARPVRARRGRREAARAARHAGVDAAGDRGAHGHVRDRARRRWSSTARPDRCFSYFDEAYSENSRYIDPAARRASTTRSRSSPARSASSATSTSSDPRFANTGEASLLRVFLGTPERGGRDLARLLEWEYWDGTRWKELAARADRRRSRRGRVPRPAPVRADDGQPRRGSVDARPARRGARSRPRTPRSTRSARASRSSARACCRRRRTRTSTTTRSSQLDLVKNLYPFGKEPKVDCILYLACDELLQTRRRVHLDRDAARRFSSGTCVRLVPEAFDFDEDSIAVPLEGAPVDATRLQLAVDVCPTEAISLSEA